MRGLETSKSYLNTGRQSRSYRGFTLVELMVALVIGLIILAALSQLFVTTRMTNRLEEGLGRVQENARFSFEFLTNDIRMAGYTGCARLQSSSVGNIVDPPSDATTFDPDGISGHTYTGSGTTLSDWSPALDSDYFADGDVVAGTDVVIIQRGSSLGTHLTGNTLPDNANIQIINTADIADQLAAGDILMVSDCKAADIFKATNTSNGSGIITIAHSSSANTQNTLTHSYANDAELMKLVSRAYYIGPNPNGEPALFRAELINGGGVQKQELIEGVEHMWVRYGEDTDSPTDGIANIYRKANAVTDWGNVVTVRIGLIVRTPENADKELDTNVYAFDGDTFDPTDDRRRRRQFNFTIQLRNR